MVIVPGIYYVEIMQVRIAHVGSSLLAALLVCTGCGDKGDVGGEGANGSEDDGEEEQDEDSDTEALTDLPYSGGECLLEVPNDCDDPLRKCMPWAESMGPPTETRCCPLSDSPVSVGDRCEIQDHIASCLDNCPAGSICIADDVDTLTGYCQDFCDTQNQDSCGANQLCRATFDNNDSFVTVPVCAQRCDPLQQDCAALGWEGWLCQPTGPTSPEFFCHQPTGPTPRVEFEECMIPSDCSPGLSCLTGTNVLGCEDLNRCCTSYCDTTAEDSCNNGNACISLDSEVPGSESVGLCANPA